MVSYCQVEGINTFFFGSVKMIDKVHFVSFFNGLLLYCLYDSCKYTTKKCLCQVLRIFE